MPPFNAKSALNMSKSSSWGAMADKTVHAATGAAVSHRFAIQYLFCFQRNKRIVAAVAALAHMVQNQGFWQLKPPPESSPALRCRGCDARERLPFLAD